MGTDSATTSPLANDKNPASSAPEGAPAENADAAAEYSVATIRMVLAAREGLERHINRLAGIIEGEWVEGVADFTLEDFDAAGDKATFRCAWEVSTAHGGLEHHYVSIPYRYLMMPTVVVLEQVNALQAAWMRIDCSLRGSEVRLPYFYLVPPFEESLAAVRKMEEDYCQGKADIAARAAAEEEKQAREQYAALHDRFGPKVSS